MAIALDPEQNETRVLHDLVDLRGADVLEVGCGDGRLTWRYAERSGSILAIDPNESDIALARERTPDALHDRITFRTDDVITEGLGTAAFDVALLSWSL